MISGFGIEESVYSQMIPDKYLSAVEIDQGLIANANSFLHVYMMLIFIYDFEFETV